ncbi:MAG: hypothetical protein IPM54_19495 [Polyangiaceae bacterium]|nr:hypothetical protein [Polyangiaceae bacterium]
MKYPIIIGLLVALAAFAGCGDGSNGDTSRASGQAAMAAPVASAAHGGMSSSTGTGGNPQVCDDSTVVDNADGNTRCENLTEVKNVVMAPANTVWADKVDGFSTEYGPENYGAKQAVGAPNVYPTSGDQPKAWAQSMMDADNEFIKVGFSTPIVAEAVWVFETFNPGAISKITVTAEDGDHVVYESTPMKNGFGTCAHVLSVSTKTCSPISAVRIDLDSKTVEGYNEIDAIGLIPAN